MPSLKYSTLRLLDNWTKNHRHHGGVTAMARCCYGSWRLSRLPRVPAASDPRGVDCVTFSVVPNLTALWAKLMRAAIPGGRARVWIGDCSGGFRKTHHFTDSMRVQPMINYLQGLKLDQFFAKYLRSEYLVVSDDDVFWLDQTPWNWAMEEFAKDPKVAVVSLVPRERFTWDLDGRQHQPMGSYCLVVKRDIWLKESLSFQAVPKPSPSKASFAGHYDTCDMANVELIKRGYKISIAPPEIRSHLAAFKGISSSVVRVHRDPPEGYAKAFGGWVSVVEGCMVCRELERIVAQIAPEGHSPHLMRRDMLDRAERELAPQLPAEQLAEMRMRVSQMVDQIRGAVEGRAAEQPVLTTRGAQ